MTFGEILALFRAVYYDTVIFSVKDVGVTPNHIVVAAFAIVLSIVVSRLTQRVLRERFLSRFQLDPGLEFALLRVIHYCILVVGVYVGLATLNIPLGALVGFFTLLGVGIGFGLQNVAANFISGLILLFERPVKIGDRVTVDDVLGEVTQINLRTTVITTPDNVAIIVPNSKLLENNLINWTYGDRRVRIHVPVGVAYGSDVNLVTRSLLRAAQENQCVLADPPPAAMFTEFGESSLDFDLVCWIADCAQKPGIMDELHRAVDRIFREHDIEIPFPQRDLHLRSVAGSAGSALGGRGT